MPYSFHLNFPTDQGCSMSFHMFTGHLYIFGKMCVLLLIFQFAYLLLMCYKECFTQSLLPLHNSWHQSLLDLQHSSTMIVFSGDFSVQCWQKKGKENIHSEFIVLPKGQGQGCPSFWPPSLEVSLPWSVKAACQMVLEKSS